MTRASRRVRWRRSIGDFVDSKDRRWKIEPLYCGRTRPEVYQLLLDGRVVAGNCATQREAKSEAERISERSAAVSEP